MAPEQAEGRAKFVGPAADVWALGVILYDLLTGTRPFDGQSPAEILARVLAADPPAARAVNPAGPRNLDTVVAKCLTKEPDLRYPTAVELADDLARFAAGEAVKARRPRAAERAVRWARRKPAAAAAWALAGLVLLVGGFAISTAVLWRQARSAADRAEEALGRASQAQSGAEDALRRERERRSRRTGRSGGRRRRCSASRRPGSTRSGRGRNWPSPGTPTRST
jgi:hypothetical protein